jgi:hypothetical protein
MFGYTLGVLATCALVWTGISLLPGSQEKTFGDANEKALMITYPGFDHSDASTTYPTPFDTVKDFVAPDFDSLETQFDSSAVFNNQLEEAETRSEASYHEELDGESQYNKDMTEAMRLNKSQGEWEDAARLWNRKWEPQPSPVGVSINPFNTVKTEARLRNRKWEPQPSPVGVSINPFNTVKDFVTPQFDSLETRFDSSAVFNNQLAEAETRSEASYHDELGGESQYNKDMAEAMRLSKSQEEWETEARLRNRKWEPQSSPVAVSRRISLPDLRSATKDYVVGRAAHRFRTGKPEKGSPYRTPGAALEWRRIQASVNHSHSNVY